MTQKFEPICPLTILLIHKFEAHGTLVILELRSRNYSTAGHKQSMELNQYFHALFQYKGSFQFHPVDHPHQIYSPSTMLLLHVCPPVQHSFSQ